MKEMLDELTQDKIRKELKAFDLRGDKAVRWLTFLIFSLVILALGISTYTLNYLLRFNADEIDTFISENLKIRNSEVRYNLPRLAISTLAESELKIGWNSSKKMWFFENIKGKRVPYDHHHMIVSKAQLISLESQYGIRWDGDQWILPKEFSRLKKN